MEPGSYSIFWAIVCGIVASSQNRSVGWGIFWGLFFGFLAFIIYLIIGEKREC